MVEIQDFQIYMVEISTITFLAEVLILSSLDHSSAINMSDACLRCGVLILDNAQIGHSLNLDKPEYRHSWFKKNFCKVFRSSGEVILRIMIHDETFVVPRRCLVSTVPDTLHFYYSGS